ncbi:hypothetical protein G5C65_34825, partial [Streptomyces sp. SB3404]|nr:hypothetical protein [Streptomyces boncukensis]
MSRPRSPRAVPAARGSITVGALIIAAVSALSGCTTVHGADDAREGGGATPVGSRSDEHPGGTLPEGGVARPGHGGDRDKKDDDERDRKSKKDRKKGKKDKDDRKRAGDGDAEDGDDGDARRGTSARSGAGGGSVRPSRPAPSAGATSGGTSGPADPEPTRTPGGGGQS